MFIHLHCHSHYSFLRGVASPDEIIAAAVEQNMPAVALTDTNAMHAAVSFYKKAKDKKIKPIVGVALDVEFRISSDEFRNAKCETRNSASVPITLLAMDMEGYSNLCQLTTLRHLGTTKLAGLPSPQAPANHLRMRSFASPRMTNEENGTDEASPAPADGRPVTLQKLAQHNRGVIALCPLPARMQEASTCRGAARCAPVEKNSGDAGATGWISQLKDIFADRLYIEVHHLSPGDGRTLREAEHLGRELSIPLVATNNVHFLKPEEHLHHRAVNAIRTGGLLTTVAPPEITTSEAWFKSAAEMQNCFPDHPEWLAATLEIAGRCNLELELNKMILPECSVPDGESAFSYLWKLSFDGASKRYKPLRPEVLSRLTHELEVIEHWHLAPYFLLVQGIVEEARRRGIPAVARGSAASSMVTYCLGISRV